MSLKRAVSLPLFYLLLAIIPQWGLAQAISTGDTTIYTHPDGIFTVEITGLPGVGCGNQSGLYKDFGPNGNGYPPIEFEDALFQTVNRSAGQHHLMEVNRNYQITAKITHHIPDRQTGYFEVRSYPKATEYPVAEDQGTFDNPGPTYRYVSNSPVISENGSVYTYNFSYQPTITSGTNSDVLWLFFNTETISNDGGAEESNAGLYIPIYVLGAVPGQEVVDVIDSIISPTIPYFVVHDPPGDQSFTELSESNKFCSNSETQTFESETESSNIAVKLGYKGMLGIFTTVSLEAFVRVSDEFKQRVESTSQTSYETCISQFKGFKTPDGSEIGVIPGQSYFFSTRTYLAYGTFDAWYFDDCEVKFGKRLVFAPTGGDPEEFFWSENRVKGEIIKLQQIVYDNVSTPYQKAYAKNQAAIWEQILSINTANKASSPFVRNQNFSAGIVREFDEVSSVTESHTLDINYTFQNTVGLDFLVEFAGSGVAGGFELKTKQSINESSTANTTNTKKIFYSLGDDDADGEAQGYGDDFIVEVLEDQMYGTPIFNLKSGSRTSSPYEGGYQRDQPFLSYGQVGCDNQNANIINAPLGEIIDVPLKVCNNSDEPRSYYLDLIEDTNVAPGAILTLGGVEFPNTDDGRLFENIPASVGDTPSCTDAILKVEQNGQEVDYKNIKLVLTPKSDTTVRSIINLSVNFGNGTFDSCGPDPDPCAESITIQPVIYNSPATLKTNQSISTAGSVIISPTANVNYSAKLGVNLNTDFQVSGGGQFKTDNDGCIDTNLQPKVEEGR